MMPNYQISIASAVWLAAVYLFVERKRLRIFWLCLLLVILLLHFWMEGWQ